MSPRATAYTVAGTIAAATLALISVDLFLLAAVIALVIWLAVSIDQRDEASTDYVELLFVNKELRDEVERLNVECDALNQENMRLHLSLTELQLATDPTFRMPHLRVVSGERDA